MRLICGDSLTELKKLDDGIAQTCVTSPPYWGLRDYGVEGQLGLEKTPEEYVAKMVEIFREVRRVLRDDGTLWLNLGDSYTSGGRPDRDKSLVSKTSGVTNRSAGMGRADTPAGLKPKDLVGVPWRVAFALQTDGWYLRSDIIWSKPNPMPESVTDRPTKAHEYIFLMSKSAKYYYDAEAIKEPVAPSTIGRRPVEFGGKKGREYKPEKGDPNYRGGNEQWGRGFDYTESCKGGCNKRSVWVVATKPFPDAHFAVFPPKLIEPCVLAGSASKACAKCGAPWERMVDKPKPPKEMYTGTSKPKEIIPCQGGGGMGQKLQEWYEANPTKTLGFEPTCKCKAGTKPSIVLDPFAGSGTTCLVAEQKGRGYIGIELNPEYIEIAKKRLSCLQPEMFA